MGLGGGEQGTWRSGAECGDGGDVGGEEVLCWWYRRKSCQLFSACPTFRFPKRNVKQRSSSTRDLTGPDPCSALGVPEGPCAPSINLSPAFSSLSSFLLHLQTNILPAFVTLLIGRHHPFFSGMSVFALRIEESRPSAGRLTLIHFRLGR